MSSVRIRLREAIAVLLLGAGSLIGAAQPEAVPPAQATGEGAESLRVSDPATLEAGGGSDPTAAVEPRTGTLYVAWTQAATAGKRQGPKDSVARRVVVACSADGGRTFSRPVVASGADTEVVSSTVSPAQVALGPKAEVYVLYGRRVPSESFEHGRAIPRLVRSTDEGCSFSSAVSEDEGKTFSKPLALLTDSWVPYADVKLATDRDGQAWVAFEDRRDERRESLILARVNAQGRVERSRTWPGTAPDIAVSSRGAFVAFASAEGAIQVRLASPPPVR